MDDGVRISFCVVSVLTMVISLDQMRRCLMPVIIPEDDEGLSERYYRHRGFRRLQIGILFFLAGALMMLGSVFSLETHPSLFVWSWFLVGILLLWSIILCIAEMISTNFYHRRLRTNRLRSKLREKYDHRKD